MALRPWTEADADSLYALASDPAVAGSAPFPVHRDKAESLRVIREVFCAPETYAVISRGDGRLLGCISVFADAKGKDVYTSETITIGYWLGRPYWGQGLMAEAVETLCSRCFHSGLFACECIAATTGTGNSRSRRVLEKTGFRFKSERNGICAFFLSRHCQNSPRGCSNPDERGKHGAPANTPDKDSTMSNEEVKKPEATEAPETVKAEAKEAEGQTLYHLYCDKCGWSGYLNSWPTYCQQWGCTGHLHRM